MMYQWRNWTEGLDLRVEDYTERNYQYQDLLVRTLGRDSLLFFLETGDYQGDWVAIVSEGEHIGLINGYFGSCGGCDALEAAESAEDRLDLVREYLQSVRTFDSWEDLSAYIRGLDPQSWEFRESRKEILKFAEVGLPLGALDIFGCLMRDGGRDPIEAALSAKALN